VTVKKREALIFVLPGWLAKSFAHRDGKVQRRSAESRLPIGGDIYGHVQHRQTAGNRRLFAKSHAARPFAFIARRCILPSLKCLGGPTWQA
jgi:hypothetical protein